MEPIKNKKPIIIFSTLILSIVIAVFCWWLFFDRYYVFTRDSYVHGNQVRLTSQISGYVSSVYCEETEYVEEGKILITLDDTDNKIAFNRACANLGTTIRQVTELFENVYSLAAVVRGKEANLIKAEIDFTDRRAVVESGAISQEEYIHSATTFSSAKAALEASSFNLKRAIALVGNTTLRTHPRVSSVIQEVKLTYVNLQRCAIKAPASGIVAQRGVQVGESISPSSPLLAIVPMDQVWVDANFKEIHMADIRIGQKVTMTSDYYGRDVIYNGTVIGIAGGTGAVFSPLPPQNATGNWIKIVQRVPVRVSIHEGMIREHPLRLGLSMNVKIDIRDLKGLTVPNPIKDLKPLWKTDIFHNQECGVEQIIDKIFSENESFIGVISKEVKSLGKKYQ